MKKTFEELVEFAQVSNEYLKRLNGNKTKLSYAINRVLRSISKKLDRFREELNEKMEDINVNYCSEDSSGNLLIKDDKYLFTRENQKRRLNEQRNLRREFLERQIEFDPYFSTEVPKDLTDEEIEIFADIVIKKEGE